MALVKVHSAWNLYFACNLICLWHFRRMTRQLLQQTRMMAFENIHMDRYATKHFTPDTSNLHFLLITVKLNKISNSMINLHTTYFFEYISLISICIVYFIFKNTRPSCNVLKFIPQIVWIILCWYMFRVGVNSIPSVIIPVHCSSFYYIPIQFFSITLFFNSNSITFNSFFPIPSIIIQFKFLLQFT